MSPGHWRLPPPARPVAADLDQIACCPALLRADTAVGNGNALLQRCLTEQPDWRDRLQHFTPDGDRDRRLGRYFENLVALMVSALPRLQLIARNLPIRVDGRTLGELDMLVHDHARQRLMHWELTVKFYVGLSGGEWPGPDPRDRLTDKHQRLLHHQFPLLRHPATRAELERHGWQVDEQYLFSAGRLFYPADARLGPPEAAAPEHLRGTWWSAERFRALDGPWLALHRNEWLSGPSRARMSDNQDTVLASAELADYVQSARRPLMVWHARDSARQPGFVIPEEWPP